MNDTATDFDSYPQVIKECWAIYQALRRLGFTPDELFISDKIARDLESLHRDEGMLGVVLKHDGKQWSMGVGQPPKDWGPMMLTIQSAPEAFLQRVWEASTAKAQACEIVISLQQKGLYPL